jgi:hypothetical protein
VPLLAKKLPDVGTVLILVESLTWGLVCVTFSSFWQAVNTTDISVKRPKKRMKNLTISAPFMIN